MMNLGTLILFKYNMSAITCTMEYGIWVGNEYLMYQIVDGVNW